MARQWSVEPAAHRGEEGAASVVLPMTLWAATLIAIALIDIGAYLVAAGRAQSAADAAALAAVAVDAPGAGGSPQREATRVVAVVDARLERCDCRRGSERATVEVSVAVPGLVIPTLGAGRVTAQASAVLVVPEPDEVP